MSVEMLALWVIWTPLTVVASVIAFRVRTSQAYAVRFAQRLEPAGAVGVRPEGSAAAVVGAHLMSLGLLLAAFLPSVDHGRLRPAALVLATVLFFGFIASAAVSYSTGRWGKPRWAVPPAFRQDRGAGAGREAD